MTMAVIDNADLNAALGKALSRPCVAFDRSADDAEEQLARVAHVVRGGDVSEVVVAALARDPRPVPVRGRTHRGWCEAQFCDQGLYFGQCESRMEGVCE